MAPKSRRMAPQNRATWSATPNSRSKKTLVSPKPTALSDLPCWPLGRISTAIASFVLASTLAPEDAEAYFGAGYAYRLNQQSNLAVPQLKKAIELRPDYYEAKRELAYCYHSTGVQTWRSNST